MMRATSPFTGRILGAAILLVSIAYYAIYLNSGFNYADDGNYAQICYELVLGRPAKDLAISYGLLWFKIGAWLFEVFGVHYVLVKLVFFACIIGTNLLMFCALHRVSGNAIFAAMLTAVTLLVPAFPATAFYGFCILLNAAAQLRLADRQATASPVDAGLAGAALAISFQIRPDFGFIFVAPLVLTLMLAARGKRRALSLAVAGAFVAASIPLFLCAVIGGYADVLVHQYTDYPALLIEYLLRGLRGLSAAGPQAALQRPPLAAILSDNGDTAALTFLIYLPLISIAGFAAFFLLNLPQRIQDHRRGDIAQAIIAVTAGVAAFPHYFLFRPDLSHVANYMPGFVLMAGVFVTQIWRSMPTDKRRWRPLTAVAGVILVAHLAFYAWVGLQSRETGSIGLAAGRSEKFKAANGVNVRVTPEEKDSLIQLRDIVLGNSKPGDAIVCVPYCPGIAFMTARHMLFGNFYVDDAVLTRQTDWLPMAIAETQRVRPPVVIVMDWAVNGTERSLFKNWAAPYISALNEIAARQIAAPGLTIYLLNPTPQTIK